MIRTLRFLAVLATCLLTALPLLAGELSRARPEEVGLSSERLERIDRRFKVHVESGEIVGALGMVARHGRVAYVESWGRRDRELDLPMTEDTLFRIYSMSKPITSVGVLVLYEEGRFFLKDPVGKYLPELANLEVLSEDDDGKSVRASARPMTIRDLLRHTSGLTYGVFGDTAVDTLYREQGVLGEETIAEMVTDLGELPLLHHPGTRWHYGVSTDVLGRLIEVVSGKSLGEFLEERIFAPLGMDDTSFTVADEDRGRFARMYSAQEDGGRLEPSPEDMDHHYKPGATFQSGGGGLVSTAEDYLRFSLMLLNGGVLDGTRILSPKTVELMTRDHLSGVDTPYPWPGNGFGLGVAMVTDPGVRGEIGSKGTFAWGGMAGTDFFVDPREDLVGVFMIQILPFTARYGDEFQLLTYQAIVDP